MAYAVLADLKQRLGSNASPPGLYEQLTDRITFTTADDTVGQAILDAAHGEVNGHLARRYAVSVDVSSDTTLAQRLKGVTLDIAEKAAWESSPTRRTTPQRVVKNYAAAIQWLRDVEAGKASLPGAAAIPSATADGDAAKAAGHARVMTEDAMDGLL